MPRWFNPPLRAYNGTDTRAIGVPSGAVKPGTALSFTPNLAFCRPFTDFAQGFYLTTRLHQAREWANAKVLRTRGSTTAVVLEFRLDRDRLAALEALSFGRETSDFWDFVHDCRGGFLSHGRTYPRGSYDLVYGPVTLWPQRLTIQNCDQISFHTTNALTVLGANPTIKDVAPAGHDRFP
jgi:Protein of unknown function (DUF3990)